jgi:hypothetical protein
MAVKICDTTQHPISAKVGTNFVDKRWSPGPHSFILIFLFFRLTDEGAHALSGICRPRPFMCRATPLCGQQRAALANPHFPNDSSHHRGHYGTHLVSNGNACSAEIAFSCGTPNEMTFSGSGQRGGGAAGPHVPVRATFRVQGAREGARG